jgi:antitoxin MazE
MKTHVQKWGNSLAVRIPKALAEETGLREDSCVEMNLQDGAVVIRPTIGRKLSLEQLLAGVTARNIHQETDFGEAVGNELW